MSVFTQSAQSFTQSNRKAFANFAVTLRSLREKSINSFRVRDSSGNVFLCCACGKKALQRIARPAGERHKRQKEQKRTKKNKKKARCLFLFKRNKHRALELLSINF
jgi:hypothetical protein